MSYRLIMQLTLVFALFLSGCTLFHSDYETPVLHVTTFKALPTQGIAPRFEIGLHVINPNRYPLELEGLHYIIEIEGHRILEGVANQLPVIAAYGEGDVTLEGSANIINSLRLLTDLSQQQRDRFKYEINVKLDAGSLRPRLRVEKEGEISLISLTR
ncbi:MAG: hypothetical protein B6I37_03940 [Desulfobacteraceae bacterium 4572_35.2]|nr:MAG: hypothetical protein B6I37_03940 [Desulfobacteraceae bacterium 4572_35.2]